MGIVSVAVASLIAWIKSRVKKKEVQGFYLTVNLESIPGLVVLFFVIGICLALAYTGSNPFIYFQF